MLHNNNFQMSVKLKFGQEMLEISKKKVSLKCSRTLRFNLIEKLTRYVVHVLGVKKKLLLFFHL